MTDINEFWPFCEKHRQGKVPKNQPHCPVCAAIDVVMANAQQIQIGGGEQAMVNQAGRRVSLTLEYEILGGMTALAVGAVALDAHRRLANSLQEQYAKLQTEAGADDLQAVPGEGAVGAIRQS